ncbi:hypothetical protein Scep_026273 [Stephania cephalantha]|uniref:Uncharacterized protein n=1 Tax=Stephania cephalantha TaxID=152367 RepID=A0AAP0EK85_9MAGN
MSHNGDITSFNIMGNLTNDESGPCWEKKKPSQISLNVDANLKSNSETSTAAASGGFLDLTFYRSSIQGCVTDIFVSSDGYIDVCMGMKDIEYNPGAVEAESPIELKFECNKTFSCLDDDKALMKKERMLMSPKSSLERIEMTFLTCKSEQKESKLAPRTQFLSPFKKIVERLEPFIKSKSQQSSPNSMSEPGDVVSKGLRNRRKRTLNRLLLSDFLNIERQTDSGCQSIAEDRSSVATLPTHLNGLLKLKIEHGVPFFEFSTKDPEILLTAKIWKTGDSFNCAYTFHSLDNGTTDCKHYAKVRRKDNSMLGQMQVSCHLCPKMRRNGTSSYSMVAEFVLYDVAHARKDLCTKESSKCSTHSFSPTDCSSEQSLAKGAMPEDDDSDALNNTPWGTSLLHRNIQTTAVSVEIPFEDEESFAEKMENKAGVEKSFGFSDLSAVNWKNKDVINCINLSNVKVITSYGIHGVPSTDGTVGPSSLLDRWRLGGGCDCGGWDMACPLVVFECPTNQDIEQKPFMKRSQPLELFVEGLKEEMPAISIEVIDEGLYSVKFHSRLSMLQAFSISVAIVHGSEICSLVRKERDGQDLHCNSPKLLLEEEVRFFVDALAQEKKKVGNTTNAISQSSLLNPPFSPFARS